MAAALLLSIFPSYLTPNIPRTGFLWQGNDLRHPEPPFPAPVLRKEQMQVSSSVLGGLAESRAASLLTQPQFPAGKAPQEHFHSHKLGCFLHFAAEEEDNWEGLVLTFLSKMPLMTPGSSPSTARSAEQRNGNYCVQIKSTPTHPRQPSRAGNTPTWVGLRDRHSFTAREGKGL